MTKLYRRLLVATLFALAFLAQSALADTYYDYADVLSATPITQTVYGDTQREVCRTVHGTNGLRAGRHVPDGVSGSGQGYSLADVIRQDIASTPQTSRTCETVSVREPQTRTVGYRVAYRYGNKTYTRTLENRPGDRIRVRVKIDRP
ncbi:MAG: hypothetical protein AAFN78_10360 [Pseudomonadota bacterium]